MRVALALTVLAFASLPSIASAQTDVRPRFLIAFDTSGSMTVDLDDIPTYGDGVAGATRGIDTNCDGLVDDSRMYVAKEALRNVVWAFGDIEFALARFPQFGANRALCNDTSGLATGLAIQSQECDVGPPAPIGPFVGSIGDPRLNTGALISTANCGAEWNGLPGTETPFDLIPTACRPTTQRFWASGSPSVCINYIGACPGTVFTGLYTFPQGDVLVGFQGFGWPATQDNRPGILRWIDGAETAFNASTTSGNFCNHAGGGDCELRPNGPTPLGGLLRAARDYIAPIRAADPIGTCRPYTVLLMTDGAETCNADPSSPDYPVNVANSLRTASGIPTYVVGLAIGPGGRTLLNQIATAGGTDAGGSGGDTAFFADDPVTLSAGLADIVADSLLFESCNSLDDDCDTRIDEGFVKYCDRPGGVTTLSLCTDPGERVCNGVDDNCDGMIDEGLLNACGTCGPAPTEICNGLDDDCDGVIDDGGVCAGCMPAAETCNGRDDDCDLRVDEMLTRACGVTLGECRAGTQTCTAGTWGACSAIGPGTETCNGLDDDCDGLVDDLTRPCGTDIGECVSGIERCIAPMTFGACEGSIGPAAEVCNGRDDDCDTRTDEGTDTMAPCGTDEGECTPGVTRCRAGRLECEGAIGPAAEICNDLDDDCDALTDEGLDVGVPCGTDVGECVPGRRFCRAGAVVCEGAIDPTAEACNELDDDCDGRTDEGTSSGMECGVSTGLCEPGTLMCSAGREVCVGGVPAAPRELCNCEDDDCDGTVDEDPSTGPICPGDSRCLDCSCSPPCVVTEFGTRCPTGRMPAMQSDGSCYCVQELCSPAACAEETVEVGGSVRCAPGRDDVEPCVCRANECTFACAGVVCDAGLACDPRSGRCVEDNCRGLGCPDGRLCDALAATCFADRCEGVACAADEACRDGACEASCAGVDCPRGQSCHAGACSADACADRTCGDGMACDPDDGSCVDDACDGPAPCPSGAVCEPSSGDCSNDPCTTLRCPGGEVCVRGECARRASTIDGGTSTTDPAENVTAAGSGLCAVSTPGAAGRGAAAWSLLAVALALGLARRRRRLAIAVAIAGLIVLAGCSRDAYCLANCDDDGLDGGGAADGSGDDGAAVRRDATGLEDAEDGAGGDAACLDRELCNAVDDDCDGRVDEEVDTSSDPDNCGRCGLVCAPAHALGECTDGTCGVASCDVGFYDFDGDPTNGCEYGRCLASAADDVACDLLDDDCDGSVDEDVDLTTSTEHCGACGRRCRFAHAGASCVASSCVRGACEPGFVDADGMAATGCEYSCTPASPPDERCNARDDDCDGTVDEGNPEGGGACGETRGVCTPGTLTCVAGVLECVGASTPGAELLCDGRDEDCDGAVDETFDRTSDPVNCGTCGTVCARPHAVTRCSASDCTVLACESGYVDLDPAMPGCEYMCDVAGGEACNGADDDCDGRTDEGVTLAATFCNANGVCAGTTPSCRGAAGWVCDYAARSARYQDSESRCDAFDNDCDGRVDEAFPTRGAACSNGMGRCRTTGTIVCSASELTVECNAPPAGMGMTEACNGQDDDCDGRADEAIAPTAMPTVRMSRPGGGFVSVMSYEASRPDATGASAGTSSTAACSRAAVLPWTTVTWADAQAACCALNAGGVCGADPSVGWRLCDEADWEQSCRGPGGSCTYAYGTACTTSAPTRCNGAEHDSGAAAGDQDALYATGSPTFPECRMPWAAAGTVYDLSGNVKEWTATEAAPGVHVIRGGSYNNLEAGRTCAFDFTVGDGTFAFPNTGFRCCFYER